MVLIAIFTKSPENAKKLHFSIILSKSALLHPISPHSDYYFVQKSSKALSFTSEPFRLGLYVIREYQDV